MLGLIPAKHITSGKSRDNFTGKNYRSGLCALCKSKFQLMVRHEDYPNQNQNKVPELVMMSFAFCLHMALLISKYDITGSSYYRERGSLKHAVLVFWVEGQSAVSGD